MDSGRCPNGTAKSFPLVQPILARSNESELKLATGEWLLVKRNPDKIEADSKGPSCDPKSVSSASAPNGPEVGGTTVYRSNPSRSSLKSAMSKVRAQSKGGKTSKLRVPIWIGFTTTGSAGGVINAPVTITPASSGDVVNYFSKIFDEMRVTSIEVHSRVYNPTPSTSVSGSDYGHAFDDADNTALTSVPQVLDFDHHIGPCGPAGQPGYITSSPTTTTGFQIMRCRLRPVEVIGNVVYGSNWFSTLDTNAVVGYLKPYVEAGGASEVFALSCFYKLTCEFKNRV